MSELKVKADAVGRSPRIKDESGLIYLKFFCSILMIFYHSSFFSITVEGPISTVNFVARLMSGSYIAGIFPLILPATAGGMLILRMAGGQSHLAQISRIPFSRSWRILRFALILMSVGTALNFLLYRHEPSYYPYFQSTLQFLSLAFVLLWLCLSTHFASLFALAVFAVVVTAEFAHLRTYASPVWMKVLFESDGRNYLWPLFPWAGVVALSAGLQWKKAILFGPRMRYVTLALSFLIARAMVYWIGRPVGINPASVWSASIFQPGGYHSVTIMAYYVFFWTISCWLCEKFPIKRFGVVHVFGQGILYVYVTNIIVIRMCYLWLRDSNHSECLARAYQGNLEPCLVQTFLTVNALMYLSCWAVAYVVCRYFLNSQIKIRLKPRPA